MAVYAIGDVQGCFEPLQSLLGDIGFKSDCDQLWFVGDLVNRGPRSLDTLRFVRDLGENAVTLLGNHDLHLLGVACGVGVLHKSDTIQDILSAPDREELLEWLRSRPFVHRDDGLGFFMVHAGLHPGWSLEEAERLSREVAQALQGENGAHFLREMYSNIPIPWSSSLTGWERLRSITDYLTRLRFCSPAGDYLLSAKGKPGTQPQGFSPWYAIKPAVERGCRILFGHWSTLGGTGSDRVFGLDDGCLWGGQLTALRLGEPLYWYHQGCPQYSAVE